MNRRTFLASLSAPMLGGAVNRSQPASAGRFVRSEFPADDTAERARALHSKSVVIVMHDHRPIAADVPLMLAGGVTAKVYQIGVDVEIGAEFRTAAAPPGGWAARARAAVQDAHRAIEADPDRLLLARTADDIRRAKRDGKVAILLGVEGGKLLEGKLERLAEFHEMGLRELQLRWAVPNELVEQDSLTDFGRAVVGECHRLGIIVDLTHIPERAFFDAIELAEKPPIVSHGTGRNDLSDRRIDAIARRGGVIGIHFYSSYLGPRPTIERALDAIDYIIRRAGAETVGLGVDLFPTEGKWREFQVAQGTQDIAWAIPDLSHMPQVTDGLVARKYSDEQIVGILGGNFLRVCRAVFGR